MKCKSCGGDKFFTKYNSDGKAIAYFCAKCRQLEMIEEKKKWTKKENSDYKIKGDYNGV